MEYGFIYKTLEKRAKNLCNFSIKTMVSAFTFKNKYYEKMLTHMIQLFVCRIHKTNEKNILKNILISSSDILNRTLSRQKLYLIIMTGFQLQIAEISLYKKSMIRSSKFLNKNF